MTYVGIGLGTLNPKGLAALSRLYTQRVFDGGRPDADCLTPQLHTNGHLVSRVGSDFTV
jgi:hypothetical protein